MAAITPTKISIKEANDHLQQLYKNLSEMESENKLIKAELEEEKKGRQSDKAAFEIQVSLLKSSLKSEEGKVDSLRTENEKMEEQLRNYKHKIDSLNCTMEEQLENYKQQTDLLQNQIKEKASVIDQLKPKADLLNEMMQTKGMLENLLSLMQIAAREFGFESDSSVLLDAVEPSISLSNNSGDHERLSRNFSIGDQDSNEDDVM
ncbi:uncharacterized protein TRIADDRAFT_58170 [Trichoplax adhaerens]|uniref:Uncharacterized protein n=1 Tax=Trichoplax adhaerens TaxID=10228 RepID=B3S124_TRIAD|nr:hypothetical protein TRIADDRAFT_58170 [Trichoplax adhaerens]EDV23492.1 hypothetical protein TRIADDRAFT_58170 [Trichoplax adhaerens]|eukprot:XP_002114402.1 hypothetical protein TRIADDRAFT_58170 [Trichoplax adhaerens]